MRNRLIISWTVVATLLATVIVATSLRSSSSDASAPPTTAGTAPVVTSPTTTSPPTNDDIVLVEEVAEPDEPVPSTPPDPDQLDVVVDASLRPAQATIPPVHDGDPAREIARLRSTEGVESDIVLGELLVSVTSDDELQAFLDRWNGTVVDTVATEPGDEYTDHLVSVDIGTAPVTQLAADLLAVEPHHAGEYAAGDDRALALLSIAAHESAYHGTDVALNWMTTGAGVAEGTTTEDETQGVPDAFQWSWISSTSPQATGIDAAWQLMHQNLGTRVKIMVIDGGFVYNEDLPIESKIRHGEWGAPNPMECGSGPCPWHGTDVAMAAMGELDNRFGTAGPASEIADLIAVVPSGNTYQQYKRIKKLVKEERPDVINMSFGADITSLQGSAERIYGRWFRQMRDDYGALAFAAAGNDGIDVDDNDALTVPCELPGVVCVGGTDTDALRHDDSNYGTKTGGGSVEIYGPYCVIGLVNPDVPGDGTTRRKCGTSFASPVVAGVAALVMAANPTLGPKQVWQVMKDTAHEDPLGAEVTGHVRRIDAYRAVATALGRHYTLPTLGIDTPTAGQEFATYDFVDLSATAQSFAGHALPIQWSRPGGDVINAQPTTGTVTVGELTPGKHTFIATATDVMGNSTLRTVEIQVANVPPGVSISSPAANTYRYTVEEVLLDGSTDDPDLYWASLADDQVRWAVRPQGGGDPVFTAVGHEGVIPAGTLPAGDYEVAFVATDDGGATRTDTSLLTMLDVPPGESLPTATMISPVVGEHHDIGSGDGGASVRLTGVATDAQDGALDGTRMRWIAEQGETRLVLCEGSALGGGGGIAVFTDCSDVTVELPVPPEAPTNIKWTITLEAFDSADLPGRVTRTVGVQPHAA